MPSIQSVFGLLEKLESERIAVHQNRCVAVRNRHATCRKCADACVSGCISLQDDELVIEPEHCIGCGTCATVCPTCALEAKEPQDAELYQACVKAMVAAGGQVVIACEQIMAQAHGLYDPAKVVGVACLGRVDESLCAMLAAHGATEIVLVQAKCDACECTAGIATAELVAHTANTLFEAWGKTVRVRLTSKFPAVARLQEKQEYDTERRAAFSSMRRAAKETAADVARAEARDALGMPAEEVEAEPQRVKVDLKTGTLPQFVPGRRKRLAAAMHALGSPVQEDALVETRLWGEVAIDEEKCMSCRMCTTFCPTGALRKFETEEGAFGVEHRPNLCVRCGCCTDICSKDAISLVESVAASDLLSSEPRRFEMKPMVNPPCKPDSIFNAMKSLLGTNMNDRC